ncbi:GNAT family N-acetyltransferase [Rheinheimera sp. 4Y26]|uniref:GNAT family N-acetyltransferase n=1 Tax=Rheinheimera sp. 4Y26 TaxID=2977811 RepID=UPI0021B157D6|nr:GNAT family N-acetyltransferase [Rheinheimera sp. 4Y26]MCT6698221.1 GNAT family N-acetyltransferase [Rheinheimera sp. 4Y26]
MTAGAAVVSLPALLLQRQQQCRALGWRLPLWLQTSTAATEHSTEAAEQTAATHPLLLALLKTQPPQATVFWLGDVLPEVQQACPWWQIQQIERKSQLLGAECDVLVINTWQGIDWDLVAASAGCVKAGGLWLLYSPVAEFWLKLPNPKAGKLRSYPYEAGPSAFLQSWLNKSPHHNWLVYHNNLLLQDLTLPAAATDADVQSQQPEPPYLSQHQQQAVAAIFQLLAGHRRRPLLLTAHRGRGKSAALGIAAALLQQQGKNRLAICAPHPDNAAVALQMAKQQLQQLAPDTELALSFWPVDVLLAEKPKLDLLLIDEAAAIPTPQLQQLVAHYSRVVLASTEHGYEGTGRGFLLKFQPYLDAHCPGWQKFQLQQAIRYAADCPLEQLIFQSFLLATEYQLPQYQPTQPLQLKLIPQTELAQYPRFAQMMALLSLAHYQTSTTDLWALLDNPALQLFTLWQQHELLACAVISLEGALPDALTKQIYRGERRVQGHLMAQSLAFHLASPELARLKMARIQRIAVSPVLQSQGLGTRMLALLQQYFASTDVALLGSSFGCTSALLHFWQRAGYLPVKLSQQTEQASSEASILMLKAVQPKWQASIQALQQQFSQQLYWQLADSQRQLCPALAVKLAIPPAIPLPATAHEQLQLFSAGHRPYELVEVWLLHWFNLNYQHLPAATAAIFVKKLWQKHSWQSLGSGHTGKKALILAIQQAVSDFIVGSEPLFAADPLTCIKTDRL